MSGDLFVLCADILQWVLIFYLMGVDFLKFLVLLAWLILISPLILGKLLYEVISDINDRLRWWLEDDEEEVDRG